MYWECGVFISLFLIILFKKKTERILISRLIQLFYKMFMLSYINKYYFIAKTRVMSSISLIYYKIEEVLIGMAESEKHHETLRARSFRTNKPLCTNL